MRRRHRLSANLPVDWLLSTHYDDELTADAWTVHTRALMWCMSQDSDGLVPMGATRIIGGSLVTGQRLAKAIDVLVKADLWRMDGPANGLRIVDWAESQTTAEERAAKRRQARERVAAHRATKALDSQWNQALAAIGGPDNPEKF